jgi:hypothetical protein
MAAGFGGRIGIDGRNPLACFYGLGQIMCTRFCTLVAGADILDSWGMGLFGMLLFWRE